MLPHIHDSTRFCSDENTLQWPCLSDKSLAGLQAAPDILSGLGGSHGPTVLTFCAHAESVLYGHHQVQLSMAGAAEEQCTRKQAAGSPGSPWQHILSPCESLTFKMPTCLKSSQMSSGLFSIISVNRICLASVVFCHKHTFSFFLWQD